MDDCTGDKFGSLNTDWCITHNRTVWECHRLTNLQLGEVTAHRDRLRNMLNDIRKMAMNQVCFQLGADIMNRIEGPAEDVEKRKGVCVDGCICKKNGWECERHLERGTLVCLKCSCLKQVDVS